MLAVIGMYRRDYDAAEHHLRLALDLNPNDADSAATMGGLLTRRGKPADGLRMVEVGIRLNPLHPAWYYNYLGITFYSLERYAEALQAFRRLPTENYCWKRAMMAACLSRLGRVSEAKSQAERVLEQAPKFSVESFLSSDVLMEHPSDSEHFRKGLTEAGLPE
jgi:tetratricopeptide (TPR) repeat protein